MRRLLEVDDTPIAGLKRVRRSRLADARGFLARLFCADELRDAGWDAPVAQINHTMTARRGSVRGLHFQRAPHAEKKLVHCLRGEVWDVAVDLRQGSPTFLRWHAERLSADNGVALLIPEGFAHGFQTLADDVEMLYVHSVAYSASDEGGVSPDDARLAIDWPLPIGQLSPRDAAHRPLAADFEGLAP
ncbi:MAG: dTDP-4-dehydrorhamnose 3,5-epimerase [Caldimonas sp.]